MVLSGFTCIAVQKKAPAILNIVGVKQSGRRWDRQTDSRTHQMLSLRARRPIACLRPAELHALLSFLLFLTPPGARRESRALLCRKGGRAKIPHNTEVFIMVLLLSLTFIYFVVWVLHQLILKHSPKGNCYSQLLLFWSIALLHRDFLFRDQIIGWGIRGSCKLYLELIPDICHGRHGRRPCKFFLAGVNFYRFIAKNWHFRQILREKVAFFTDLTRKIGVFRCKFYSPKILPV